MNNMVRKGDNVQCPQCAGMGRVVWVSENGNVMGVKCSVAHCMESMTDSFGFSRPPSKSHKNSVFLVNIQPK